MTSVDTNNAEKKLFFLKKIPKLFFSPVFGVIGLQVQDEPERTLPSCPARKKMVVDLVEWYQRAKNAEK